MGANQRTWVEFHQDCQSNDFNQETLEQIRRGETPEILNGMGARAEFFMGVVKLFDKATAEMNNAEFESFKNRFIQNLVAESKVDVPVEVQLLPSSREERARLMNRCLVDATRDDGIVDLESFIAGLEHVGFNVSDIRDFCHELNTDGGNGARV